MSKLSKIMNEVNKMASEGLISAEDLQQIKNNVEEAKQAGVMSALGFGSKSPISGRHFKRMARGALDSDQASAVHSAFSMAGDKGRNILRSTESAQHAINVAAAKATQDGGKNFAGHLDRIVDMGKDTGRADIVRGTIVGGALPASAVVASAIYDALNSGKNFAGMMDENPDLYDMPEDSVRRAYRTLSTYAPAMTEDPFVAGSTVKKMVEFEAVDPATVKTFQDSQKQDRRIVPRLLNVFQEAAGKANKGVSSDVEG